MTYKEARKLLHPDTTIEALEEYPYLDRHKVIDEACLVACKAIDIVERLELIQEGQMAKLP